MPISRSSQVMHLIDRDVAIVLVVAVVMLEAPCVVVGSAVRVGAVKR